MTRWLASTGALVAAAALAWPGSPNVELADDFNVFGDNLSGLNYQPSGTNAKGVLWAVRNSPSTLFRLVPDGAKWKPDPANTWGNGKTLVYPGGAGAPDAEDVARADGDANGIYVAVERDGAAGGVSRPGVLRYDVTAAGATLTATREWDLTADLPGLGPNLGPEALSWVPDTLLVSKGFADEATGAKYDPATYPNHGAGLFFVGIEQDGRVLAYALDQTNGSFTRVATIASGFPHVMSLEYDPDTTHLWAVCDNDCDGRLAWLDIAPSGHFEVTKTFDRPGGMDNINNEGFALAPDAECVNDLKPVYWADDDNHDFHALRSGAIDCTITDPAPTPTATPTPTPSADRTAPKLKVAVKLTRSGKYAVRRTRKFGVAITLGERADLTFTATARRTARAKARTIFKTTRKRVAAGKPAFTFTLARSKKLRKGETLTVTVVASDAAGNKATSRASAKVR
jgi:hypothetical protein